MNETVDRDFLLKPSARKFFVNGEQISLRNMEFSLLKYFMENVGKVLTRTELLEEVWDRNICCSTNTVDVHVSKLRRKFLELLDNSPIKTIHSVGYIFEY